MGSSSNKDTTEHSNGESGEARSAGSVDTGHEPADIVRAQLAGIEARAQRRKRLLEQDALGRTPLFYAAEKGLEDEVREIIFSFRGTGLFPPRLSLIAKKDRSGLTAADVAEQNGYEEIERLLRSEQGRMEYFE
jgi:hypothetical protein